MDVMTADPDDEVLLLDLLNTTPVVDGLPHDDLADPKAAGAWMRQHGIASSDGELAALAAARTALQAVIRGERAPRILRRFLATVALRPVVTDDGVDWQLATDAGSRGAVRAILAWDAVRITSPGRLRPCANAECRLFLFDRSKPNTARWCSMAICGNRMKARRYYRKARSGPNPE
jgi:predicted RNA-binding Zn ribbon-like protein